MDSGHSIDWTLQPCEPFSVPIGLRLYRPVLTAHKNGKGCLDVDTVKGCTLGMKAYPMGGCYSECYAYKNSIRYGFDFGVSVSRRLRPGSRADVFCTVRDHAAGWYRIGVAGDPSHDWENTVKVCEFLAPTRKLPVIITKHWIPLTDEQLVEQINSTIDDYVPDLQVFIGENMTPKLTFLTLNKSQMGSKKIMNAIKKAGFKQFAEASPRGLPQGFFVQDKSKSFKSI